MECNIILCRGDVPSLSRMNPENMQFDTPSIFSSNSQHHYRASNSISLDMCVTHCLSARSFFSHEMAGMHICAGAELALFDG